MSLLTYLCLTSLLCLSLADPVPSAESSSTAQSSADPAPSAESWSTAQSSSDSAPSPESSAAPSPADPEPTDDNEPLSSADVQAQVQAILDKIEQILVDPLSQIQKGLTGYDKDYSTFTLIECFKGCLNNLVYMRNDALYSESAVPKSNAVTMTFFSSDISYLPSSIYEPGSISGAPDQGTAGPDYCLE